MNLQLLRKEKQSEAIKAKRFKDEIVPIKFKVKNKKLFLTR